MKLLDYGFDHDHNRLVVTAVGEPQALKSAVLEAIGKALELIDMTTHRGQQRLENFSVNQVLETN